MRGLIVKNISDNFDCLLEEVVYKAKPRGRLKKSDKLIVGDYVECDFENGELVISGREDRKNQFVRPPIANIDVMCIVVTEVPRVDKFLVDKLIIKCTVNKMEPILVINKCDIVSGGFVEEIKAEYGFLKIYCVSALTGDGVDNLKRELVGRLTAFAGQSAVGKSKLSAFLGAKAFDGEISVKTMRGKHTTRHTEIHILEGGILVADTPGFSRLDINEVHYKDLKYFYPEFKDFTCKYNSCDHIDQKICDCAVKVALNDCKINQNRYNRYVKVYKELKQFWESKYD